MRRTLRDDRGFAYILACCVMLVCVSLTYLAVSCAGAYAEIRGVKDGLELALDGMMREYARDTYRLAARNPVSQNEYTIPQTYFSGGLDSFYEQNPEALDHPTTLRSYRSGMKERLQERIRSSGLPCETDSFEISFGEDGSVSARVTGIIIYDALRVPPFSDGTRLSIPFDIYAVYEFTG